MTQTITPRVDVTSSDSGIVRVASPHLINGEFSTYDPLVQLLPRTREHLLSIARAYTRIGFDKVMADCSLRIAQLERDILELQNIRMVYEAQRDRCADGIYFIPHSESIFPEWRRP